MVQEKLSFSKNNRARTIFRICNYILMIFISLITLIPLLKVLSDSFDVSASYGINLWPRDFSTIAYQIIFRTTKLYRALGVSIYTTAVGTVLGLTLTTLGAYVLIQKNLIGRRFFSNFVFITMIFNGGLIPMFVLLRDIKLINTLWAVLLPASINVYNMVLMKNFFEGIPNSLFEAAEIDGCSPLQTFIRIVLPLSLPALSSIGLFFAVAYWNEFFNYVMFITDRDLYNFQVQLREIILNDQTLQDVDSSGHLATIKSACVIVAIVPFMAIYPFAQRYFITGVTMGAVKE